MSSPAQTLTQARWHRRARHALAHSLRVRLVALFLLLALAMAATFLFGMQKAFSIGWRDAARPLVVDYVDRLAAEIGSPPRIERAQALVQRLPVAVRISGPQVNWRSHPANPDQERRWNESNRWKGDEPRLLERTTAAVTESLETSMSSIPSTVIWLSCFELSIKSTVAANW